jgi:hypothetical protein
MKDPMQYMGLQRAFEAMIEAVVPISATVVAWIVVVRVLSAPAMSRPLTSLELTVALGCCAAVTGWAVSRQFFMLRQRRLWVLLLASLAITALVLFGVSGLTRGKFATWCADEAGGELVPATEFVQPASGINACRVGGVPGNPYLPGVVFRASWPGSPTPWLWAFSLGVAAVSTLALRDRRLLGSRMAARLYRRLLLAPAAGSGSAAGKPKPEMGKIQACANATLWGELCGQLYSTKKEFLPGEACVRCYQPFRRADQMLTFRVVTLFSKSIDVLNGLERLDTVSWSRGEPMPPDARISGAERWVDLGRIQVPDVITVAQALALIQEMLPGWESDADPRKKTAIKIAQESASRVSAWIWLGPVAQRLTYARPSRRALLAIGPTRLRDLAAAGGEELTLQLDVGLVPLEMRVGFKKTFLEEGRAAEAQNSKVDMWIPVSPGKLPPDQAGLWVPRIEGAAMRAWLSTERLRREEERGTSVPLPYEIFVRRQAEDEGNGEIRVPRPGTLDFVRMPLDQHGQEPTMIRSVGASIAEWEWLEWQQIQLLRRECLVLVSSDGRRS